MEGMKPCPQCAEMIREAAVFCRYCRTNLQSGMTSPGLNLAGIREAAGRKFECVESGRIEAAPPGPGRITAPTWVFGIITVLLVGAGLAASREDGCLAVAIMFAVFVFIPFLVYLGMDLAGVPPSGRTTPERGVRAYYGALRRRQYSRAYACLSPLDRTTALRNTRSIPGFSITPAECAFDLLSGFKRYWRTLAGAGYGLVGTHKRLDFRLQEVQPVRSGWVMATIELRVTDATLSTLLGSKKSFTVHKLLVERDGLWWMANGEFWSEEDEVLEAMLSGRDHPRKPDPGPPPASAPELPEI